jgi:ParB family transcriptional regulator, chromosome partitioning protein
VRRSGLGKGLGALIPTDGDVGGGPVLDDGTSLLQELPVAAIEPNPNQPRVHFDEEALNELTESIRAVGVLQPILVRPLDDARYQLVAGERRWRAARRAGLAEIPAIVRTADDLSSVEHALVENLHRQDLSALEEAAAYQQLLDDFGLTHDEVARRVGKSRATVTNTLRLLHLPGRVQQLLTEGRLSAGHAKALLALPDRHQMEVLAERAADEQWSVRTVEEAVREALDPGVTAGTPLAPARPATGAKPGLRPPGILELEELLSGYLDTRVKVNAGSSKGKVVIEYATLEDLERIYRLITEAPPT